MADLEKTVSQVSVPSYKLLSLALAGPNMLNCRYKFMCRVTFSWFAGEFGTRLDRKRNVPYQEVDNLTTACGECNVLRGNIVSYEEMRAWRKPYRIIQLEKINVDEPRFADV